MEIKIILKTHYFDPSSDNATLKIYKQLISCFPKNFNPDNGFVLFCIGTDRITGDSLGPLVGYKLKKLRYKNFHVYGTLEEPIHALNIDMIFEEVIKKHPQLPIIAVDASLGHISHLGCITVSKGSLKPGIGVKKNLKTVGDVSITGIVCCSSPLAGIDLQTTRLSTVMKLADCISDSLSLLACNFSDTAVTNETKKAPATYATGNFIPEIFINP